MPRTLYFGRNIFDSIHLGLNSVQTESNFEMRGGISVLIHSGPVTPVTSDLVRKLAEEE